MAICVVVDIVGVVLDKAERAHFVVVLRVPILSHPPLSPSPIAHFLIAFSDSSVPLFSFPKSLLPPRHQRNARDALQI